MWPCFAGAYDGFGLAGQHAGRGFTSIIRYRDNTNTKLEDQRHPAINWHFYEVTVAQKYIKIRVLADLRLAIGQQNPTVDIYKLDVTKDTLR